MVTWPPPLAELTLDAEVPGAQVPAGSKRGMAARFKNEQGRWRVSTWFDKQGHEHAKVNVSDVNSSKLKARKKVVDEAIIAAIAEQGYMKPEKDVPLAVEVVFYRCRSKGEYRSGKYDRILKPTARAFPATTPDTTKLWRAFEDSLTETLWDDDSRVVNQLVLEDFVHRWEEPKTTIKVWRLPETIADLPEEERGGLETDLGEDQTTLLS